MANVVSIVLLAFLAAAYRRGVNELWRRRGVGAFVPAWRMLAFTIGIVSLIAVQLPAVEGLAQGSLTGHMAQHMILLLLAGPLLAAGAAGLPLALSVPVSLRRRLAGARARPVARWLRRPVILAVVAAAAHAAVVWAWHLPSLYMLALTNSSAHVAEHASFVAAAWLLWSLVLGRAPHRLAGPVAFLLLFATMMPASALAAVFTFAPTTIYPVEVVAAQGGDPLIDQQLAGLVMWVPMDVAVLTVGTAVLLRWLRQLERTMPSGQNLVPQGGPAQTGP
ncbi:cytochrome c oxidase assembly protein [Micromonospora sp. B11E3]|uniref:cytochrome c oxidase assembly protein n=1 Tax=Micromonospora sp. B11E3 TaxID=3153562 RepID=UPI00325E80E4